MSRSLSVLFVSLSAAWAAAALPMIFATAADDRQGGEPSSPVLCGNVSITFPFEVVQEQATERNGDEIRFQVRCSNNTPYLGFYGTLFGFKILDIFYGNGSLVIADVHKLQDFNVSGPSGCHIPRVNSSTKLGAYPFSISAHSRNLIFYNCIKPPVPREGLVETSCGNTSFARIGRSYHEESGAYQSYFLEGCEATIVPVRDGSGWLKASRYEELISDGFLVTWQPPPSLAPLSKYKRQKHNVKLILIVYLSATASLVLSCLVWIACHQKKNITLFPQSYTPNIEEILKENDSLIPKRYKYSELKKLTGSFKDKIGEGGYGVVFKGNLEDGRTAAVKILKGSKGNGEEFLNEVVSIRRTSHVNVINLLGFCLQGSKRALIYEYMANGSLDKYIYSEEYKTAVGWEKLQHISIGIARGLEYLHRGCNTRIVHFDIKPHNVLLDEDFCPRIADFGLAKLCNLKDSALSIAQARGTIGFIAPEVFSRGFGVVSTKSDVYSYGMMLLEMVGGRMNVNENIENSSEAYFPNWIYDHLVKDLQSHEVTCEIEEIARKMTLVGLWCIQTGPVDRPSMSRVIEMLENNITELQMPPKPFLSCPSQPQCFSSYD